MSLLLLLACSGEPPAQPEPAKAPQRPPDLLVVVLDTVRAEALGAYGNPRNTSPSLDALAAQGVLFEAAWAPGSWTWPSHASLFTGQPPWVHGAHYTQGADVAIRFNELSLGRMDPSLPTLAERLGRAGYDTACVSANLLLREDLGLTRGFDQVAVHPRDDEAVLATAGALLEAPREAPLFLVVNLFEAHGPYGLQEADYSARHAAELDPETAPEWVLPYLDRRGPALRPFARKGEGGRDLALDVARGELELSEQGRQLLLDLYEGEVAHVDEELGQLLQAWDGSGRAQDVVVVTGDHGEFLGERGGQMVHGRSVYPEVLRVPLVLRAPGFQAGQRVEQPVSVTQVHHNLLELAGLEATGAGLLQPQPVAVKSWVDPWWAEVVGGRYAQEHQLLVDEGLALVLAGDRAELYDLQADPALERDLAAQHPQRVTDMRARLEERVRERSTQSAELDEDAVRALQALGYIADEEPQR